MLHEKSIIYTWGIAMSISGDTLLRQWQTLRFIPRFPRRISGRDLAERLTGQGFSVTKRTVERDLQSLSASFPLIVDTRSIPYGWSWEKGAAAIDVPGMSAAEAMTFAMLRQFLHPLMPPSILDQLAPYFGMAEQRLEAFGEGAPSSSWGKKIAVVPPTQSLLPPKLAAGVQVHIQEALFRDRQVRIRYRKRGETTGIEYIAHPLGLIQRGSVFYLVCTLFEYPETKLLVLHRMRQVDVLDEKCTRPKGFNLTKYIQQGNLGFGPGTTLDLIARFRHEAGEHLFDTPLSVQQSLTKFPDGRLELRATVPDNLQLRWWLQGFADGVEVISPESLRIEISTRLRRAAETYQ